MTENPNNETAEPAEATDAEIPQQHISDSKLLFAPLVKYAVAGVLIVSAIVSTTILLNTEPAAVDENIAVLESETSRQNPVQNDSPATAIDGETELSAETTEVDTTSMSVTEFVDPSVNTATDPVASDKVTALDKNVADTRSAPSPANPALSTSLANVPPIPTTPFSAPPPTVAKYTLPAFDHKARIAEQQAWIKKQDQEYLDAFRTRQAEQIKWLRDQLARQQKRIEEIEKRNQQTYEMRASSIKRMQQAREESLNRI